MLISNFWSRSLLLITVCQILPNISSLPKEHFYPYGPANGDTVMAPNDEGSSEELSFYEPFFFYQVSHRKAYVNINGLISFDTDISYFANQELIELRYSLIAGFYADIDTHVKGEPGKHHGYINYRITNSTAVLRRCKQIVTSKFSDVKNYEPKSVLIATWDNVGYYDSKHDKANTFQIVLMQGRQSYVEFLYADNGIQWTKSDGKYPYIPDAPAQVGFANDDGRSFLFKMSGKEQIKDINKESNIDLPGDYLFRVSGDTILEPKDVPKMSSTNDQLSYVGNVLDGEEFSEGEPLDDGDYYDDQDPEYGSYDNVENPPNAPHDPRAHSHVTTLTSGQDSARLPPAPPVPIPDSVVTGEPPSESDTDRVLLYNGNNNEAAGHVTEMSTPVDLTTEQVAMATTNQAEMTHPPMVESETQPPLEDTTTDTYEITTSDFDQISPNFSNPPPLPFCDDDPYKSNCPSECHLITLPPGCQKCQCPTYETTESTFDPVTVTQGFVYTHPAITPEARQQRPNAPSPGVGPGSSDQSGTCAQRDPTMCHQNSTCTDYAGGFCCQCSHGFYGNGKECLPDADAQRLNGKVYGKVNGITLPEIDLHTYAVPTDGRAYTALSQMDPIMGQSFLLLSTIGNVMGWLFAKPSSATAYNGFMLTGGLLNRSVTVHLGDRHTVTIQQEFFGKDIFQYFKVKVFVTGTLPELPPNSTLEHREYFEEFNRVSPGIIKSYSTSTINVNTDSQNPLQFPITIDQTIRYNECPYANFDKPPSTVLRIERSYVFYDPNEKIVRYASGNTIDAHGAAAQDPCKDGAHDCIGQHMFCARDGTKYRCLCLDGYELIFANDMDRKGMCLDLNECARNTHRCDSNAMCHNTEGSYTCICNPGYRGTGYKCIKDKTCGELSCDRNADCITTHSGTLTCLCKPGFAGDGYTCTAETTATANEVIGPTCSSHEECHRHAACNYNEALGHHQCQCRRPYSGDGRHCFLEAESCDRVQNCDPNADCIYRQTEIGGGYKCRCKSGFAGDGYSCTPLRTRTHQCNPGVPPSTCGDHANCIYEDTEHAYVCKCDQGYEGDGLNCQTAVVRQPEPQTCQQNQSMCHTRGRCVPPDQSQPTYHCECNPGYKGDGIRQCDPERAVCSGGNICDVNAECITNERGEQQCRCNHGFEGDGQYCKLIQGEISRTEPSVPKTDEDLREKSVVFAQGMSLVQRGMNEDDVSKQLIVVPHQIAVGVDFDCKSQKLFWTDVSGHAIRSADRDGSNVTLLFDENLDSPEGIAVDFTSGNIYYTDSELDIIAVATVDGRYNYPLVKDGLVNPRALAIDFYEKKLYFSDWHREKPLIGRLNLDGTQRENFITNDIALPNSLVVLHRRRELCWADAGKQRLECIGLQGAARRVVFAPLGYPFGLTVQNEETFVWTDWEDKKIHSVTVYGGNHRTYTPSLSSSAKLYGITSVSNECPQGDSPCSVNNGGCKYLCLPDPRGSRTCVCPENLLDPECNTINAN